jgi:hypothetical protein
MEMRKYLDLYIFCLLLLKNTVKKLKLVYTIFSMLKTLIK